MAKASPLSHLIQLASNGLKINTGLVHKHLCWCSGEEKKGKKRKAGKEKHLLSPWWLLIFPVRDVWRQNNHCAYGLRAGEIIVWSIQISGERGNRPKADGLSCWVIRQRAEEITQWIDTIETTQTQHFITAQSWARCFFFYCWNGKRAKLANMKILTYFKTGSNTFQNDFVPVVWHVSPVSVDFHSFHYLGILAFCVNKPLW